MHPNQLIGAPGYRYHTDIEKAIAQARFMAQVTGRHYGLVQKPRGNIAVRQHRPDSTLKFMWSTRNEQDKEIYQHYTQW